MRLLSAVFALWFGLSSAFADSSFVAPTANGTAAVGQLPGTTTNDNACAGCVGEVMLASANGSFTATITIAAPAVISGTHSFNGIAAIVFTTDGSLPTGITSGTTYYTSPSAVANGNFNLSTTVDNAVAGTFITTTGSQSGTQTATAVVALSNGTVIDAQALRLTAGDWEVWFYTDYTAANTTAVSSGTIASISPTSITLTGIPTGALGRTATFVSNGSASSVIAGPLRVSTASSVTYYGAFRGVFTISTMSYTAGRMYARRTR